MKTTFRIIAWVLSSLIIVAMIAIAVLVWWVFTPEKITPVVQKELNKMLTCETQVDRVELTFFSTFPDFALHLHGLTMVQPMEGAPSDTLLRSGSTCATVDVMEFLQHDAVVVRELLLEDAMLMLFVDASGQANYSVMPPSEEEDTSAFALPFARLEIEKIEFNKVQIAYHDMPMKLAVDLNEVNARMTLQGKNDLFSGRLNLQTTSMDLSYDSICYIASVPARISTDYTFDFNRFLIGLPDADLVLNGLPFDLSVMVENNTKAGDLLMDITFASLGSLQVQPVLDMIPSYFQHYMEGISLDGKAALKGKLKGVVNENSLPHFSLNIALDNSSFAYEGLPYTLREMSGVADIVLDMNDENSWHILVEDFDARTFDSHIMGYGKVDDLMGDMRFDLKTKGMLNLADATPMLPDSMQLDLKGIARGNMNLQFRLSQMMNFEFDKIKTYGKFHVNDFRASYDTLVATAGSADLTFRLPNPSSAKTGFAEMLVQADRLDVQQGELTSASMLDVDLKVSTSNLMDSTLAMVVGMEGTVNELIAVYNDERIQTGALKLYAELDEVKKLTGNSMSWLPRGSVQLANGRLRLTSVPDELRIPVIAFDFTPDELVIKDSRLNVGFSDFQLKGSLSNLDAYLNDTGLLKGRFDFVSSTTDVNYLMNLFNGLGYEEEELAVEPVDVSENPSGLQLQPDALAGMSSPMSGPFMVPKGVDFELNVRVDEAFVSTDVLSDVRGSIAVKDGLLGLESVLFTASAARMQLNALYHSPRRNHLFLGLDFHLTHIEIEELLMMIPDIDTIMPMLRSFGGRGEFHFAAETYLDSTYRFKPSTIRGVASVSGEELVLMDGETFSEIAKILMFNKKTVNKVDSLAAEFTLFKTEVDIYPFQIVMDKYKAVISGKHNLDMNFNYHISLTDSPVPFALGVDVSGNLDDLKIRLAKPRYARLYRPAQRREIDRKQLEIKQMIRNALTQGLVGSD